MLTPHEQAILEFARKRYSAKAGYADASDEQVLRWIGEDAAKAASKLVTPEELERRFQHLIPKEGTDA